ncbi:MAG: Ig-like domain-containing protein [Erysipelotrichaceae bacterium]|nr:Ig-like domain-containing protein [Erysipelotrichaceae bacterium]
MKKKIMKVFLALLTMILCVSGCSAKKEYTVNFNTDGGSFIEAVVIQGDGQKVNKPADPVKEGYTFKEWQLDGKPYDFDLPLTQNITLVAVYEKNNTATVTIDGQSYTVSFRDGEIPNIQTPKAPEGKSFKGWKIDGVMGQLSDIKDGSKVEAVFEEDAKKIPCTGIKTQYNNYWTIEGTKAWNLEAEFTPYNTTDVPTYTSEDEKIVTVDQKGNVTAKEVGKTKIHIKCGDQEKVIGFETRSKKVGVDKINLASKTLTLYMGGSDKIKATVEPDKATDKTLEYVSSDKNIATVDSDGNVKGKYPGVTTIKVKAASGVSAECKIIVEGETVMYEMEDGVTIQEGSGQKIPYRATYLTCYDGIINKYDVTTECDFYTSDNDLDIDGYGNVYQCGSISKTQDIEVYFRWSDGSSLNVESPKYTIHVVK